MSEFNKLMKGTKHGPDYNAPAVSMFTHDYKRIEEPEILHVQDEGILTHVINSGSVTMRMDFGTGMVAIAPGERLGFIDVLEATASSEGYIKSVIDHLTRQDDLTEARRISAVWGCDHA